jgi:hypothetical protein
MSIGFFCDVRDVIHDKFFFPLVLIVYNEATYDISIFIRFGKVPMQRQAEGMENTISIPMYIICNKCLVLNSKLSKMEVGQICQGYNMYNG